MTFVNENLRNRIKRITLLKNIYGVMVLLLLGVAIFPFMRGDATSLILILTALAAISVWFWGCFLTIKILNMHLDLRTIQEGAMETETTVEKEQRIEATEEDLIEL